MKQVFVLRHGERGDRVQFPPHFPVSDDPCLTQKGQQQAAQSAEFIISQIPQGFSIHIVSSPFLRCIQTASHLSKRLNIPIHLEEGFGEWMYEPDFQGPPMDRLTYKLSPLDQFAQQWADGVQLIINQHKIRAQFPESLSKHKQRVSTAWNLYYPHIQSDVIIVVSHLYVVETLTEILLGRRDPLSTEYGYCRLTHATSNNGSFDVLLNKNYEHADQ